MLSLITYAAPYKFRVSCWRRLATEMSIAIAGTDRSGGSTSQPVYVKLNDMDTLDDMSHLSYEDNFEATICWVVELSFGT